MSAADIACALLVGAVLGMIATAWAYERILRADDTRHKKITADAVRTVRREADETGYRHGYGDGYAQATAVWQQIDDAKGQVRGHMHVVGGGESS